MAAKTLKESDNLARVHSYTTGRVRRLGAEQVTRGAAHLPSQQKTKKAKKRKRKRWPAVLASLLVLVCLCAGAVQMFGQYVDDVFDPGSLGVTQEENYTPEAYRGDVINILIVGIDNEEGRNYGAGLGQTDMILYANFLVKEGKLNLLQIPRDSYVGEVRNSNGKINSLLITGEDKENPINNLVNYISTGLKLPVDHYIAMDMDALKAIVNTFGGIKVYVSQDMSYGGSKLEQGWRWLDGDATEFFVRNRHGSGFERADIDRLDNQRHFYSALFRRFLNLTPGDAMNLLPVFKNYCNTDLDMGTILSLAVSALNLSAEDVLFCKAPGATGPELDPTGAGRSFYYLDIYGRGTVDEPGLAVLLNDYFRTYGDSVPASELGLPNIKIPSSMALYSPNVQVMSSVQEEEGGADIDVEPTAG